MALINLHTLPGLGPTAGANGFGDFPKFPELPDVGASFEAPAESPEAAGAAGSHFAEILGDAIAAVNRQEQKAGELEALAAVSDAVDPHQVMIEGAKAEVMLHLTSSVVTKMAQNTQTVMNWQV